MSGTGKKTANHRTALVVAVVWVLASLVTWQNVRFVNDRKKRMDTRSRHLRDLNPALERLHSAEWTKEQWLDTLHNSRDFSPDAWWNELSPRIGKPDIKAGSEFAFGGRARLIALDLDWDKAKLDDISEFIEKLQEREPPVNIARIKIDPAATEGEARISMRLEMLGSALANFSTGGSR